MQWPTDLTDPWLTGPPVRPSDTAAMRVLVEAGLPTSYDAADEEHRAAAQAGVDAIRSLIDPMSGRIDNWSPR